VQKTFLSYPRQNTQLPDGREVMESKFAPWVNLLLIGVIAYALGAMDMSSGAAADGGTSIDGAFFPPELKMGGVRQQLTGGGTRTKYGVAKVYAVAAYLDAAGASSSLKKFSGKPKPPAAFYDALAKGTFAKTLYLQFHRAVPAPTVAEALAESLTKRLPPGTVEKFRAALLSVCGAEVAKGAKLYFMCKGETLSLGSGSPSVGATVKEKGTCAALFDVYVGKTPISPAAKDGIGAGFGQRLYLAE